MTGPVLPTAREMVPALLVALSELGGSGIVRNIESVVASKLLLTEEQLAIPHDKSRTEFQYRLAWSRSYAKKDGLVLSTKRNHWSLPDTSAI
jgi:restriction system protein